MLKKFLLWVVRMVVSGLLLSFVVTQHVSWFLVPLGVPEINLATALGLVWLVQLPFVSTVIYFQSKFDKGDDFSTQFFVVNAAYLFVLLFGFILSKFV